MSGTDPTLRLAEAAHAAQSVPERVPVEVAVPAAVAAAVPAEVPARVALAEPVHDRFRDAVLGAVPLRLVEPTSAAQSVPEQITVEVAVPAAEPATVPAAMPAGTPSPVAAAEPVHVRDAVHEREAAAGPRDGQRSPQDPHGLEVIGACRLQLGSELISQDLCKHGVEMGQRPNLPIDLSGRRVLSICGWFRRRLLAGSHACARRFDDPWTALSEMRLSSASPMTTPVSEAQRSRSSFW